MFFGKVSVGPAQLVEFGCHVFRENGAASELKACGMTPKGVAIKAVRTWVMRAVFDCVVGVKSFET
jgi:hypothetical protein